MIVRDDSYIVLWLKNKLSEWLVPFTKVRELKEGACVGKGKGRGGKISTYGSVECRCLLHHTNLQIEMFEGIVGLTIQALNFILYSGQDFNY